MQRPAACALLLLTTYLSPAQTPPVSPERAPSLMKLPEGFRVTLCAGEPQLVKPIAIALDDRGRLWVVESHSYPNWITDSSAGHDRVLIYEDRKGDGHFDSCKVFMERGTNLSGIAVGFGGVWLCATPYLLFVPIDPATDRPAGKPVVVLDGWDIKAKHNVFNALTWGPDGWLYGCNGILSNSRIGKPGTPEAQRVRLNCGVWRYHPTRQVAEAFAHGTTNPWGLDFDDHGEMFITNCVIKHLFHVVPGAHFQRMFGQDLNPYCYDLMGSCADHIHWGGGSWTSSRGGKGTHDAPGGGHAHAGALVYLGDNWPSEYRNHIFMCNLHGSRLNQDILERHGSGYVAHHGKDFLLAEDDWFRGLGLVGGPDGGVYVSDWHDTGECHNYDKVRPCGRIFKVTFGKPAHVAVDLAKLGDEELVRLQLQRNDWWVRHARRLLQERAEAKRLSPKVRPLLLKMLHEQTEATRQLRVLWALHVIGGLDEKTLVGLLHSKDETVRGWAVRLLVEDGRVSENLASRFTDLARQEPTAWVRLALASALQRLPVAVRWSIAEGLGRHAEDAGDANLPLMIWYGLEPLAPADPERAARLLARLRIPLVRQNLARRLGALGDSSQLRSLVRVLADSEDGSLQRDLLLGVYEALQGQRHLPLPDGWTAVYRKLAASPDPMVREKVLQISVIFGDPEALAALRKIAADAKANESARRAALQTLVEQRIPELLPLLRELLGDRPLRGSALRGLAACNDPSVPGLILRVYGTLADNEKPDAIATLSSRPAYALALLDAMEHGQVPRRDLSAFTVRQLLTFKDRRLTERLNKVWGSIRPPSQEKAALLARYLRLADAGALKKADRSHGRGVFARTCATCHTLFNEGGKIGPDLTGSQRARPEYVLSKVLDPNAVVARDYQVTVVVLLDGRTLNGIVKEETAKIVTLQTQNELVRVAKADIEDRQHSTVSMMPEGLLAPLSDAEVRDLLAYLGGPAQVPLPPTGK